MPKLTGFRVVVVHVERDDLRTPKPRGVENGHQSGVTGIGRRPVPARAEQAG
jgi:hypothetical protein